MSVSDMVVGADQFSASISSLLHGIEEGIDDEMAPCVRKSCAKGVRQMPKFVNEAGIQTHVVSTDSYARSFGYKVSGSGKRVEGEIGSKTKPGLVHLLEKGHAKVGGGRVRAYPHVAKDAESVFEDFELRVDKAVGRNL